MIEQFGINKAINIKFTQYYEGEELQKPAEEEEALSLSDAAGSTVTEIKQGAQMKAMAPLAYRDPKYAAMAS